MSSALTWLDFSDQERRRVLDVIKLFRDQGTVDELGVGAIRDGLADLLFPGTSTLHTRAGYLLFIPWIYQQVEASKAKSRDPWRAARTIEVRLIDELASSEDPGGTIGINVRRALKTFPSTIYWAALGVFRIRLYRGSQGQYHRWVTQQRGHAMRPLVDDEGTPVGIGRGSWHPSPDPPPGFPRGASFSLASEQARYLRERMTGAARDRQGRSTLLSHMLAEGLDGEDIASPWMLEATTMPRHLAELLHHAHLFSLAINGAPLLYNLMLAEKAKNSDKQDDFRERLREWAKEIGASAALTSWNRAEFWEQVGESPARVTKPTRDFITTWLDLILNGDPSKLVQSGAARALILEREGRLKGSRARLINAQALRSWGGDSGTRRLDYRWDYVKRIVGDIFASHGESADA